MDQELVQYLDERFGRIEQHLDRHDRHFESIEQRLEVYNGRFEAIDRRFEQLDLRFEQIDHRFAVVDRRFEDVNERIRHNGVLIEGVRHELHRVAEGLLMHIEVRHREDREYFDRKFEDTHSVIRSSYDHLQQQQTQLRESQDLLRQRLENLERNRPN